ncbi:hypothetical protein SBOR_6101 [Sclerotinia borealis F-4128]|uniref:Zn(2)-C6 fungal-type domain-containing protein n=1 Tax=Sclerotinia borealis (strain F-4128) TaxID=1432307 RepID=W9CG40_SCLBF|nr:hypothetical protein SBOR_6101 [Sclerotinia borealis F-4128]
MRSRTGCQTCRQRKLKCDEIKPECGQCRKASRQCVPSDGVVFRHQQNASMNGSDEVIPGERSGRLGAFYAYRNTFDENSVWIDVPKKIIFVHVTDPYNMEVTPEPEQLTDSTLPTTSTMDETGDAAYNHPSFEKVPGLEALSTAATTNMEYLRQLSVPAQSPRGINTPQHSVNNLDFILNPTGPEDRLSSPLINPSLRSISRTNTLISDVDSVREHEVAFLLRHFGETTGQWMDLFDLGCYFAHHVPILAVSNPLLKNSVCAYAAKQLSRVGGKKAVVGGISSELALMELYPDSQKVDWVYIGAKYYDKAISLLMEELAKSSGNDFPITPTIDEHFTFPGISGSPQSIPSQANKRRRLSRPVDADETIAAAAILCVYEFLDNANLAWSRHLSGTKSLFDLAEREGMMPLPSPSTPGSSSFRTKPSIARRATFWNFARQDFLAAFINEGQTRLNTEDWDLWRAAGLLIDDRGFVIPSNKETLNLEPQISMREDMISNALIWLMSKIVNFIATGDSIDNVYPQDKGSPTALFGINQMTLLERWHELADELEVWYQGLPNTFKPCARLPAILDGSLPQDSPRAIYPEIWYSIPMCGSTMQSYHFTRILLLINKPHESTTKRTTVSDRLHSYRSIEVEARLHSHEICGIALGRPEGSVRIHQVQPLFVAGQCLTELKERKVILGLLRGIETDLGWATDYRVKQLVKDWDWQEPLTSVQSESHRNVTMGGGDRNRRTEWHHDEGHYGSYVQYPSARAHHRNSRLGHHRIQDSRYCVQKPEYRNNIAPHRANQAAISNRPNHHFLIKSKHLKEYLLTSLKSHIERIEEWLPDDEYSCDDDHDEGSHSVSLEGKDDMDWQLEREIVVQEYVWSSEVLSVSQDDEELNITTSESGHETPCRGGNLTERDFPDGCEGVEWNDQMEAAIGMTKSETARHEHFLSRLAL